MQNFILELKSTKLFSYLKSLDPDLSNKCIQFVENTAPILATIVDYFPFYTRHDANHSYNVIKRMSEIILPECLENGNDISLSKSEAFLLLCSAYGHDLGMAILPGEEDEVLHNLNLTKIEGWKTNINLQLFLRKTHSERGGTYIFKKKDSIGIPLPFVQQLNLLNKSHNYSLNALHRNLGKRLSSDSQELNLMQLASILCIADLLEYSDTRVIDGVIEQLEEGIRLSGDRELKISLTENLKHICIGSNLAVGPKDGKIIMNGTFSDPDVLSLTYKTVYYIEKWIKDYCDIDYQSTKKRLRIRNDSVSTSFEIPGKEFEQLGIRMNKQNVIGLISSNSIWNNKPENVLRELLQNSVEACRYRAFHSSKAENYSPKINLIFNNENRTISIIDNGCGMSRSTILNNFLTVGNSRAKEPDYIQDNYSSLARFGIGFWSVFTISKNAIIETTEYINNAKYNKENLGLKFQVSVNILKDYILFEQNKRTPGTTIILHLKDDINLSEVINNISGSYGIMACSEIPIEVEYGTNNFTIPYSPVLPKLSDLFGAKIDYIQRENVNIFETHSVVQDITIDIFIVFRKSQNGISFLYSSYDPIRLSPSDRYENKCICGFIAAATNDFPIHEIVSGDTMGYIANKNNPKGFEFNINRQSLLINDTTVDYISTINKHLIQSYRKFLIENSCYNTESIIRLFKEGISSVGRGGIFDTDNKLDQLISLASDLLCYELFQIEINSTIKNCFIEKINISHLLNNDYLLISVHAFRSVHGGGKNVLLRDEDFYQYSKSHIDSFIPTFFIKRGEVDLLFNNDPESYIIFQKVIYSQQMYQYICFFVSHTKTIDPKSKKEWIIGFVRGIWTGYISEKKIIGAKFAFDRENCFIQPGTKLANDIRNLYAEGRNPEICILINKLELSLYGHIDQDIAEYL
jgi:hypothetical protein